MVTQPRLTFVSASPARRSWSLSTCNAHLLPAQSLLHELAYLHACVLSHFVSKSATPWTVARQAPLSMGFPRQECRVIPQSPRG